MFTRDDLITEEKISHLAMVRREYREEKFKPLVDIIGVEGVDEVRKIYDLFDEKMLIWYAGLYDPEIGAFYFSNSARDTEGYLPDIESTAQAVDFLAEMCGICKGEKNDDFPITHFPPHIAEKISSFAYDLQDEDGYFYHKQWGKQVTSTRLGRDLGWSWRMITPLGKKTKYLRPNERVGRQDVKQTLPEHLTSTEKFKEWLYVQNVRQRSYAFGNHINATVGQIKAAGDEYVKILVEYLNENQYSENGLWQEEVNYDAVNGLMKLGLCYPGLNATLPYPEKSYESARYAIMSDEPIEFSCQFYNAWAALRASLTSIKALGDDDRLGAIMTDLRHDAPKMIARTREKILTTRCDDGNFAYYSRTSGKPCKKSQGASVSPSNVREADVNGNGCSTKGPLRYMFAALGVDMPPIFCPEDAQFVFDLMDARAPVVKIFKDEDFMI